MKRCFVIRLLMLIVTVKSYGSWDIYPAPENKWMVNQFIPNELPSSEIVLNVPEGSFSVDMSNTAAATLNVSLKTVGLINKMKIAERYNRYQLPQLQHQLLTVHRLHFAWRSGNLDLRSYCRLMNIMEYNFKAMLAEIQ